MAQINGKGGIVHFNGVQIGTVEIVSLEDMSPETQELVAGFEPWTITIGGEMEPEATEPLGIIDHIVWGPLLN